jgi:hypothetical protein
MNHLSRTHRFATVAIVPPDSNGMPSHQEDATQGQCGPRGASAKVALSRKLRRNFRPPSGWVLPEK